MSLLLDTHAFLWLAFGDDRLPKGVRARLEDRSIRIHVSAVSAIEVTIKHRIGKLPHASSVAKDFGGAIARLGLHGLPISVAEAELAGRMAGEHRDPFDRLLIAQGLLNDLTLVSNETLFDSFGVARLW
ncbi:MAG: type II toxin-antitoxin system VapC family toxin [Brevundimonas aurantiaca]|uniref:type II toxin-antitoxin system VapC family toxin n=1 Tax=Brevundimonas aurantiaca TaxID=74316 RepID=UPI00391A6A6F